MPPIIRSTPIFEWYFDSKDQSLHSTWNVKDPQRRQEQKKFKGEALLLEVHVDINVLNQDIQLHMFEIKHLIHVIDVIEDRFWINVYRHWWAFLAYTLEFTLDVGRNMIFSKPCGIVTRVFPKGHCCYKL